MESDENKPVRMAFSVTSARVQHYDDVIEYMANQEIDRFKKETGKIPSIEQITFLKKELVRYVVIRRDLNTAQNIKIKSRVLNEESSLPSWSK